MTNPPDALRIEGLALRARDSGAPIVDQVSLSVGQGEVVGLVGESGSGKSQTALAIAGLTPPGIVRSAGRIVCAGEELSAMSQKDLHARRGRRVAYMFQDPMSALNPTMRIERQLADVFAVTRPGEPVRAVMETALRAVGLNEVRRVLRAYPFELSGGMRQRVLIAMAYASRPALIVADEPTTALDVTLQAQILDLIRTLHETSRTAMLFISHDLAIVSRICARIYVMRSGQIVETGAARDVISSPRHAYTQELIASARAKERLWM